MRRRWRASSLNEMTMRCFDCLCTHPALHCYMAWTEWIKKLEKGQAHATYVFSSACVDFSFTSELFHGKIKRAYPISFPVVYCITRLLILRTFIYDYSLERACEFVLFTKNQWNIAAFWWITASRSKLKDFNVTWFVAHLSPPQSIRMNQARTWKRSSQVPMQPDEGTKMPISLLIKRAPPHSMFYVWLNGRNVMPCILRDTSTVILC